MLPGSAKKSYVALLLTWMALCAFQVKGQTLSYHFRYQEEIVSDYSGLLTLGKREQVKKDSLLQEGILDIGFINDSTRWIRFQLITPETKLLEGKQYHAYIGLDANYRLVRIRAQDSVRLQFLSLLPWLGELNFSMPSATSVVKEQKLDGSYRINYEVDDHLQKLKKTSLELISTAKSTQALVFRTYSWSGNFDPSGKMISDVSFKEDKTQYLGRKALACIRRKLFVNQAKTEGTFKIGMPQPASDETWFSVYRKLSDDERKRNISISLLGGASFDDLYHQSLSATELGNEARFRLKSKWRSLFILDSSAIGRIITLLNKGTGNEAAETIWMSALIESKSPAAFRFLGSRIEHTTDYESLKNMLLSLSLAESFDINIIHILLSKLNITKDPNVNNLVALTLSNFALSVRETDPGQYNQLTAALLHKAPIQKDTLQYLYIIGNAGMANQLTQVSSLMRTRFENEALNALRNISSPQSDSIVFAYFKTKANVEPSFYSSLLKDRPLTKDWVHLLSERIIKADDSGDSSLLTGLQFLLDNSYRYRINVSELLQYNFKMDLYRKELEDFVEMGTLCTTKETF